MAGYGTARDAVSAPVVVWPAPPRMRDASRGSGFGRCRTVADDEQGLADRNMRLFTAGCPTGA